MILNIRSFFIQLRIRRNDSLVVYRLCDQQSDVWWEAFKFLLFYGEKSL